AASSRPRGPRAPGSGGRGRGRVPAAGGRGDPRPRCDEARPATPLGEVDALPVARRRGEAFVAFLENVPDTGLPAHGGTTTSVVVTLDLHTLLAGIGVATTS